MCARYYGFTDFILNYHRYLNDFLEIGVQSSFDEATFNYNAAPTSQMVVTVGKNEKLITMRWGLIPSWSKEEKLKYATHNARSETCADKPTFRAAFKSRRCLVPALGYFEWKGPAKSKIPYLIRRVDEKPILFLGLWESWYGPKDQPLEQPLQTFTIITTVANETTAQIHDRMPCMIDKDSDLKAIWLDEEFEGKSIPKSIFEPASIELLKVERVSTYVSNSRNHGPACIELSNEQGT